MVPALCCAFQLATLKASFQISDSDIDIHYICQWSCFKRKHWHLLLFLSSQNVLILCFVTEIKGDSRMIMGSSRSFSLPCTVSGTEQHQTGSRCSLSGRTQILPQVEGGVLEGEICGSHRRWKHGVQQGCTAGVLLQHWGWDWGVGSAGTELPLSFKSQS